MAAGDIPTGVELEKRVAHFRRLAGVMTTLEVDVALEEIWRRVNSPGDIMTYVVLKSEYNEDNTEVE